MRNAVALPDASLVLSIVVGAVAGSLAYYVFMYLAGSSGLAIILAVSGLVWFATPSTDKS